MAAIHEYGLIWKDTRLGVWTALSSLLGKPIILYAAELTAETEDSRDLIRSVCDIDGRDVSSLPTIQLGGMRCVVAAVLSGPTLSPVTNQ